MTSQRRVCSICGAHAGMITPHPTGKRPFRTPPCDRCSHNLTICDAIPDLIQRARSLLVSGNPQAAAQLFRDQLAAIDRDTPLLPDAYLLRGACTVFRGDAARAHALGLLDDARAEGAVGPESLASIRRDYLIREGQVEPAAALIEQAVTGLDPDYLPVQICIWARYAPDRAAAVALMAPYRARIDATYRANVGAELPSDVESLLTGILQALRTPGTPAASAFARASRIWFDSRRGRA